MLCPDRIGIVSDITHTTYRCGCNVESTQMRRLGNVFAVNLLVSGNWSTIAKLEAELARLNQQDGYYVITCRSELADAIIEAVPFSVQVLGRDEAAMIYEVAHFFTEQGLSINELTGHTYKAKHTQTPMFCLNLSVNIPTDHHIADIREQFVLFCDECNWDGIIEPEQS